MKLSLEGHKVRIVFANPDSKEVEIQSVAEKKYGVLREHILLQRKRLQELLLCYTLDERIIINNNLSIYYSDILPKAFIVRSDEYMVITPYLLDGPFKEPTLVVEKQNANSYYNRYQHYIDKLICTSKRYQFVLDTNSESSIK